MGTFHKVTNPKFRHEAYRKTSITRIQGKTQ